MNEVPANVQAKTGADIEAQHTSSISEFLYGNLGSVTVTDGAVNPFQPDVSFRGMTASPLLGTPQGLSVFLDGVRINEPLGDVVNWDLVPQNAIPTINCVVQRRHAPSDARRADLCRPKCAVPAPECISRRPGAKTGGG
ncbi:MAG TPA: Plug domain-containing protein [Burkholderiales bacterium]|nr:Plug domain-containing protein [Burkholderiales bacterium]